ncbi:hypothetical protein L2E82_01302 [Cichorium intybus]|uniref:Uncharacterized protein n=1 Tax=Cichorium intybus TaxID=13427 RepID=A0ACB9GZB0_CICIN|nr:hypothetical protein L1887_04905 [Cichorium endivia]KAI3788533.1 hypothetical protein L2E82_01302 [Cichorium intybus]
MGTKNILLNVFKKYLAIGLVGITVTDRYGGVCPIRGSSMSPTFNPSLESFTDDYVFLEKFCLDKYKFSHGDVVIFSDPTNYKERCVKRILAMEGDYISNVGGVVKVPEGHCWVEGDNSASSFDSRSFGPIPLGLIHGRVTHIVWPPQRIRKIDRRIPQEGLAM